MIRGVFKAALCLIAVLHAPSYLYADITIRESAWQWDGSEGSNWFNPDNWQFDSVSLGVPPTSDPFPVEIGPIQYFVNDIPSGFFLPEGGANVSSDYGFISQTLRLVAWDGQTELTISNGATYTASASIGAAPNNEYVPGNTLQPAILKIDGGDIAGHWGFTPASRLRILSGNFQPSAGVISGILYDLMVAESATFTIPNKIEPTGTISNAGTITFVGDGADTLEYEGSTTFQGGGEIIMVGLDSQIWPGTGNLPNDQLINASDHTIRGQGIIYGDVINQGTIRAEGGKLQIAAILDNATGRVEIGPSGVLHFRSLTSSFGDLWVETGGTIIAGSGFKDVNLIGPGSLVLPSGSPTEFTGTVNNPGLITFAAGGGTEILEYEGSTTFQGGGEVVMVGLQSQIWPGTGNLPDDQFINASDHVIRGHGHIGGDVVNQGTIRAENGQLNIASSFDNSDGRVEIDPSGVMHFRSLVSSFGDLWIETGGTILAGSGFKDVNLIGPGPFVVQSGSPTEFTGTINNPGRIIFADGDGTTFEYEGLTMLQGGGEVVMVGLQSQIWPGTGNLPDDQLINAIDHTIRGQGIIYGNVVNQGIIRAEGGKLQITEFLDNATGRVEIGPSGVLHFRSLTSSFGDLWIETGGTILAGSWFKDVNLIGPGSLVLPSGSPTEFTGTINNPGLITFAAGGGTEILEYEGSTTFQGGGEIVLVGFYAAIWPGTENLPDDQLINAIDHTMRGHGDIVGDVVNQGTIRAENGQLNIFGSVDGQGAIAVAEGAELKFYGTLLKAKTVVVEPTGVFDFNGTHLEVQEFIGDFDHDSGTYSPGASPAISSLSGEYSMSGSSVLEVELAGAGLFDQLFIRDGMDIINGSLLVSLLDGFTVSPGQVFDIVTIDGPQTGMFIGLGEGDLVGNFGVDLFISYKAGDGNDIALYSVAVEQAIFADGFEPAPVPAQVYVLDSGERNVTVISTKTNTVVENIRVGLNPKDMAITPDGALIYVPNLGHDTVTVISTVTNAVVATVGVGAQPWRVVVTPDGAFVYVTHEGDTLVSVISTVTNTVVDTIEVGNARAILAFIPDGTLAYVLVPFVGVQVISTVTNTVVDTIVDPFIWPAGIAITPDGAFAYIAETDSAIVLVLSIASNTVTAKVGVDIINPIEIIITPDGTLVYMVNPTGGQRVSAVSTASNTEVASIETGAGLFMSMAVTPDSSLLYVSDLTEGTVSVIATSTNTITATIDIVDPPVPIGATHDPRTMALTKDADFLYVAISGSVSVISTATNMVIATVEKVGFDDPVKIVITP